MHKVLVVDDEQINLFLVREFLAREPLHLDLQSDPLAAWALLAAPDSDYALVLLDRLMPGLDGIEFLRRMKADPRLYRVPVIMQSGAASSDQVREGLQAGADRYLVKPYGPQDLISIIHDVLGQRAGERNGPDECREIVEYRFRTLKDINDLIPLLACLAASPDVVAPGLVELMLNAVEHGNLEITREQKTALQQADAWEAEIQRRLDLPEYRARFATVRVERRADEVDYTITDQGSGFDWRAHLELNEDPGASPNGRGIALARLISFSKLRFAGSGNCVVATAPAARL